jgi:hypothetical protein
MAKRSTAKRIRAPRNRSRRGDVIERGPMTPRENQGVADVPNAIELADHERPAEEVIAILRTQVSVCRDAFFRLATVRAADLVAHQGRSWDQGAEYINAEMAGLEQQLREVVGP